MAKKKINKNFKYNDNVKIVSGFYEGFLGNLIEEDESYDKEKTYTVKLYAQPHGKVLNIMPEDPIIILHEKYLEKV